MTVFKICPVSFVYWFKVRIKMSIICVWDMAWMICLWIRRITVPCIRMEHFEIATKWRICLQTTSPKIILNIIFWFIFSKHFFVMIHWTAPQYWTSSTGLTTVSKFKPRLPAQWGNSTEYRGPSQMKTILRMNQQIKEIYSKSSSVYFKNSIIMWNPPLF